MAGRLLLLALLAPYVLWLVVDYEYHFLDGVNLLFHEAGHVLLGLGGATLHFLGGTLAQLFFPAAAAYHFLAQGRRFDAWVCAIWLGESAMYAAAYIADAQRQALPLVGGHIHDWNWLLSRWGLLGQAEELGAALHVLASVSVIAAWGFAAKLVMTELQEERSAAVR